MRMANFPIDWIRRDEWAIVRRGEAKVRKARPSGHEMEVVLISFALRLAP